MPTGHTGPVPVSARGSTQGAQVPQSSFFVWFLHARSLRSPLFWNFLGFVGMRFAVSFVVLGFFNPLLKPFNRRQLGRCVYLIGFLDLGFAAA